ncbi:MAG: DUF2752 domain-containing protein [Symploca sp. SIO3E6]|nr:DUF2752 domain-containing protein [Caldora sp. SIO3E6]
MKINVSVSILRLERLVELSKHRLSSKERLPRWGILSLCSSPIVGAYFYNQGYRLSFLVCPLRHWTGIPCPTCGMTRSFMAIVRGDGDQALTEHLFGPVLFTVFLITIVHVAIELLTGKKILVFYDKLFRQRKFQLLCLLIYLLYYGLRLHHLLITGELSVAWEQSPLGQWLAS